MMKTFFDKRLVPAGIISLFLAIVFLSSCSAPVNADSLTGTWEQITLGYQVAPGYQNEQLSPDLQTSTNLIIGANGTINGSPADTWTYSAPWLELKWSNGTAARVSVQKRKGLGK